LFFNNQKGEKKMWEIISVVVPSLILTFIFAAMFIAALDLVTKK